MPTDCPYTEPGAVCIEPAEHLGMHTMALADLDPLPPLSWCQHCGDDIRGQERRVCAMCDADITEREEHGDATSE